MDTERSENIAKIAAVIVHFIPLGALRAGEESKMDVLTIMNRTGLDLKTIKLVASSRALARLVGADRTSYVKPEKKYSKRDKGAIRLTRKVDPLVEEAKTIERALRRYHNAQRVLASAQREYDEARAEAMEFAGKGIDPEEFA